MNPLKPYRVEWRPHLNSGWIHIMDLEEHPGKPIEEWVKEQDFDWVDKPVYWRLVSQHVIEDTSLVTA